MHKFFIDSEIEVDRTVTLTGQEHLHLCNVLRAKAGETVTLINGSGFFYLAEIAEISKKQTTLNVLSKEADKGIAKTKLTVFMGLIRAEKMDLVVQKLTELNVTEIVPFESSYATAKTSQNKTERLNRIAIEACKQCGRADLVKIDETVKFNEVVNRVKDFSAVLFAYEGVLSLRDGHTTPTDEAIPSSHTPPLAGAPLYLKGEFLCNIPALALIIGSEGGFSELEAEQLIKAGAKVVSLGKRILRAETAAIALTAVVQSRDW
ncbi:MAG: 16S rRNA (uracil(1498)-N(3))-methyltransferase [Firmicutes bacterium]|nr:16S rRNA (uracil(1498)-N(3))-methyltransferase [Bacillota bacterium]